MIMGNIMWRTPASPAWRLTLAATSANCSGVFRGTCAFVREGIPSVGELSGAAQRSRAFATGPDGWMRLLHWLRREHDIAEATVSAIKR